MANVISNLYVVFSANTKQFSAAMSDIQRTVRQVEKVIKPVKDRMNDLGRAMTVGVTAPIVAGFAAITKAGMDFETAFASVRKTVNASEPEFSKLRSEIRALALEIPVTADELAEIAAVGGQFNVPIETLGKFTKTMGELSITTGIAGKEIAETLGQFTNITGLPKEQIDRLGSSLTQLGNEVGANEHKVMEFGLRIAGAGAQIGLTDAQILGFGGALSSLGIEAEAGGTALSKTFIKIAGAVAQGGTKLQQFAAVAGISAEAFKKEWGENSAEAIVKFIEGLERIRKEGGSVFGVLDDMGLKEVRLEKALLAASKAGDKLRNSIKMSTDEFQRNQATAKEVAEKTRTTAAQFLLLENQLKDIGITLFDSLGPVLRDTVLPNLKKLAEYVAVAAKEFNALPPEVKSISFAFAGLLALAGPLLLIIVKVSSTIIGLVSTIMRAGVSLAGIRALIAALPLLGAVKSFGDLSAAVSLIGGTSVAATAGLVALAAAVGVAIGMFANWLIKTLGLEAGLDKLLKKLVELIPVVGKWLTGQSEIEAAAKGVEFANEALIKELNKHGIAVDRARLKDMAYIQELRNKIVEMGRAAGTAADSAKATKKAGDAAAIAGKDFEAFNDALKEQEAAAKASENAIKSIVNGVVKERDETHNLVTAIGQLERSGVSSIDIRNRLGKQITENVNVLREETRAIPPVLERYAALYRQHQISIEASEELRTTSESLDASLRKLQRTPALVASEFQRMQAAHVSAAAIIETLGPMIQEAVAVLEKMPDAATPATAAIIAQADAMREAIQAAQTFARVTRETKEEVQKFVQGPQLLAARFQAMQAAGVGAEITIEILGAEIQRTAQLLREVPAAADDATKGVIEIAEAMRRSVTDSQAMGRAIFDVKEELAKFQREPGLIAAQFTTLRNAGVGIETIMALLGSSIQKTADTLAEVPGSSDAATAAIIAQADALRRSTQQSQGFIRAAREMQDSLSKFRSEPQLLAVEFLALQRAGASVEEIMALLGSGIQKAAETLREVPNSASPATAAFIQQAEVLRQAVVASQAFIRVNTETRDSLQKLRMEPGLLAAQFTTLQQAGASAQEILTLIGPSVLKMADTLAEVPGSADAATTAILAQAAALVRAAQGFRDLSTAATAARDDLQKFRSEPAIVAAQITALQNAGATGGEIVQLMGASIEKAAGNLRQFPDSATPATAAIINQANEIRKSVAVNTAFSESLVNVRQSLDALRRSPMETIGRLQELQGAGATTTEIVMVMGSEIESAAKAAKEMKTPLDSASAALLRMALAAKQNMDRAEQFKQAWTAAMANVVTSFADGVTEMIFSGQKFSDMLKGIFKDLAKALIKILVTDAFTTIAKSFTNMLKGGNSGGGGSLIGGLLNNLGKIFGLKGASGGMVLGASGNLGGPLAATGGTGGGIGSAISGFLTNPFTLAIGGGLGLGALIGKLLGPTKAQVHTRFIEDIQNPFFLGVKEQLAQFRSQRDLGVLTAESGGEFRDNLAQMVREFNAASLTFANQGKKQGAEVQGAWDRMKEAFGGDFRAIFDEVNRALGGLKTSGPGIPETGRSYAASDKFASAVDRLIPVFDRMSAKDFGGTYSLTVGDQTIQVNVDATGIENFDTLIDKLRQAVRDNAEGIRAEWAALLEKTTKGVVVVSPA